MFATYEVICDIFVFPASSTVDKKWLNAAFFWHFNLCQLEPMTLLDKGHVTSPR